MASEKRHGMKQVDFYKLQRSIQDRFVGSVVSGFPPAPLAAVRAGTPRKLMWLGLSGFAFVALLVFARVGYGDLESGVALHGSKALVVWALLVFGIVFGLVMAFAQTVRERALPYPAGIYLFPSCVIDARSDTFAVHALKDLAAVEVAGPGAVRIAFAGGASFVFPVEAAQAPQLVTDVQAGRDRTLHALATEEPAELVAVDPLHNPRFSSPVGPRDPHAMKLPPWGKLGWAVAAGAAVVVGPALWAARNAGSDARLYARAIQADDAPSYKLYLERGKSKTEEVAETRLPLAELRDVERSGSVDALLAFQAAHPTSKIDAEIQAAVHTAMLSELERAKAKNTLGALEDFKKKYPKHGVEREYREAVDAVFARGLAAYKTRAKGDENAQAFVAKLFDYSKKNGPRVEVRFRRRPADFERADAFLLKTPSFMGVVSYPSRYFDDKHAQKREDLLGKMLVSRLDAGLSPELFDVTVGAPVPVEGDLPEAKVPTLFITHRPEWSGQSYQSTKPRGAYIGVTYAFDATFVIPGQAKPLKLKWDVFRPANAGVLKDEDPLPPPGVAEDKVYEAMSKEAYEGFGKRVLGLLLKEPPKDPAPEATTTTTSAVAP